MDGSQVITLFSSPALAHEWIQQQLVGAGPGAQLRAKAYTIEQKPVWHVLPTDPIA